MGSRSKVLVAIAALAFTTSAQATVVAVLDSNDADGTLYDRSTAGDTFAGITERLPPAG